MGISSFDVGIWNENLYYCVHNSKPIDIRMYKNKSKIFVFRKNACFKLYSDALNNWNIAVLPNWQNISFRLYLYGTIF